ncbi:MAG: hypothetical protein JSV19_08375 [Phycisphaerales bacterium]|nr:MAG: hypothetical protein JSV19_08375 [Phycisphaerales bacterium]
MAKRIWRVVAPVAIGGMVLGFGGCLGGGVWRAVVTDAALPEGFDVFGDDAGGGMEYDDAFLPALSHVELEGFGQTAGSAK